MRVTFLHGVTVATTLWWFHVFVFTSAQSTSGTSNTVGAIDHKTVRKNNKLSVHRIGRQTGAKFPVVILDLLNVDTPRKRTFLRRDRVATSQGSSVMLTRVRTDFVNRMCETFSQNPVVVKQFPELQNCAVAIESARGILHNYCQDDWIEPHFDNLDGQAVAILHLGQDANRSSTAFYTDTESGFYRASEAKPIWCAKHTTWHLYDTICTPSHPAFPADGHSSLDLKSQGITKGHFLESHSFRASHGRIFLFPGDAFHKPVAERPELFNCNENKGPIVLTIYFGNKLFPKLSSGNDSKDSKLGSALSQLDESLYVAAGRRRLSCGDGYYRNGGSCAICIQYCGDEYFLKGCGGDSSGYCTGTSLHSTHVRVA